MRHLVRTCCCNKCTYNRRFRSIRIRRVSVIRFRINGYGITFASIDMHAVMLKIICLALSVTGMLRRNGLLSHYNFRHFETLPEYNNFSFTLLIYGQTKHFENAHVLWP